MTAESLPSTMASNGSFADIFNLGDLLATNTRDEQLAAQARVFDATDCAEDRWTLMCMLFQPPQETRRGSTGLVIRKRDRS